MPLQYQPAAQKSTLDVIDSPGKNSFLKDIFTSNAPPNETMTCGFYRQDKGEPLEYVYEYDEMKIILEVEGEYFISDETNQKISAKPGDVFYFPKGTKIKFETTGHGLAFFTGRRDNGGA